MALIWFGPPTPQTHPGQRESPPHPECDVAGGIRGGASDRAGSFGEAVRHAPGFYFFVPLALAATLGFGAGLGRWTLTLSRSCSLLRITIPFFQDWETLNPIR